MRALSLETAGEVWYRTVRIERQEMDIVLSAASAVSEEGGLVPFLEEAGFVVFLVILAAGLVWEIRSGG